MTEATLADAVAEEWVTQMLVLVEQPQTPETAAAIRDLQATLDEWELLRVASVRRAILTRLEAAQMGRVLALVNLGPMLDRGLERNN